jgi:phosphoglycolate phosphatase-like HAD superfamily hydrolase
VVSVPLVNVLVLWDVDGTLISAPGTGLLLYQVAMREMFGVDVPAARVGMAGRTDRAIAADVLAAAGVADPRGRIDEFQAVQARHAASLAGAVHARGRVLPGVADTLAALAGPCDGGQVIQSLLTGNLRAMAEVKLGALGLTGHLDLDAGAYGDESENRADLVPAARRRAAARYGADFGGTATVLVGDTPLDIKAALDTGARAVGVATGMFTADELEAAGAHAVLPDLTSPSAAVAAILP